MLILYNIVYGATLEPVVWLYVPEIIPSRIVPFATMTNWFGCSICVLFTPIVIQLNGGNPYPVFLFFGLVTILLYIMNYFLMVETKGRTRSRLLTVSGNNSDLSDEYHKLKIRDIIFNKYSVLTTKK